MKSLLTPWRYAYVTDSQPRPTGCVFCRAARRASDPESLVLHVGRQVFALLNRYPYTNGHLMIAPKRHVANLADMTAVARAEMMEMATTAQSALTAAYGPHGFNIGINLGECAGAGIPGHLHLHVVPRWRGDTNFMTALAETRLVPEALESSLEKIRAGFGPRRRRVR